MQLLKWSAELELGLEEIDNQHKQLISMINELNIAIPYSQPNSAILPLAIKLQDYAKSHFKAESDIFTKYNYPERDVHEAEHAKFIDSIKYFRWQCEKIDTPMAAQMRNFLFGWLCSHIRTKDMEYKQHIDSFTCL